MKYFIDTEFIEDGKTIDLISLAIVADDGIRSLYLQNSECNFAKASDWVWRNVFPHLAHFNMRGDRNCQPYEKTYDSGLLRSTTTKCGKSSDKDPCHWATRREIRDSVLDFCSVEKHGKPEFWGYFAEYDWVAFCQLFGTMIELPKGFPMYCMDIKQWADQLGGVVIPKPEQEVHHALADAEWCKYAYGVLNEVARQKNQPNA